MDKVIGGAVLLLIMVSVWAVLPSESNFTSGGSRLNFDRSGSAGTDEAQRSVSNMISGDKTSKTIDGTPLAAPRRTPQLKRAKSIDIVDGEPINARVFAENPVNRPKTNAPKSTDDSSSPDEEQPGPFDDVHWDGETDFADLEESLLKLHAQRDGDGKLPQNVVASQVLRENVLQELRVDATAPVVLIGDYGLDHPKVIVETLKRAKKGKFLTGFTFADPSSNGLGRRVYVKVLQN